MREFAHRGIISNAEEVIKLFQGRTIDELDVVAMIRELGQSGTVSNAEHIIDLFQKGYHKDIDTVAIVKELTHQGVATNMEQIIGHFQKRLAQGTNAEPSMVKFQEQLVEEMDSGMYSKCNVVLVTAVGIGCIYWLCTV